MCISIFSPKYATRILFKVGSVDMSSFSLFVSLKVILIQVWQIIFLVLK